MVILCDVDSILADMLGAWLRAYNVKHGRAMAVADVTQWGIHECAPDGKLIYEVLHTPGFYRTLAPVAGALAGLKALHRVGHHVVLLTACANKNVDAAGDKLAWVREHLPWLSHKDVMIGCRKHLVRGDVLIDDSPENLRDYAAAWPRAKLITIDYPYNRGVPVHFRAMDYADPGRAWRDIAAYIGAGALPTTGQEASNASGGAAAPQSQTAGSSGEKERA